MKIDFFRHSLLSRGGDKMIVIHANHLVSLGYDVSITTAVLDTVFDIDPRITINLLSCKHKLGTILSALLVKRTSDLVVADIIPMVCFLSFRNRANVICFAQDYDESYYNSVFQKSLVRLFYFIGITLFRVPAIAVSYPLAELLRKRYRAQVAVVENGVDTGVFFAEPDPELCTAKGPRRAVLLLSRSDQRKGFDLAQKVVKRLSESYSELFEVWTVGELSEGLFPGLIHRDFGYVGEENLQRILSSADLLFYPTRHEGFPLMPLEALACGCPVVTTNAVPYGNNKPCFKITEIGDVETMFSILSALIVDESALSEFRAAAKSGVERHDIESSKCRFEQSLVNISEGSSNKLDRSNFNLV